MTEIRRNFSSVRFSPDGKRLAVTLRSSTGAEVWTYEIERGILSPLAKDAGSGPIWTADGTAVVARKGSRSGLSLIAVDGSGKAEQLTKKGRQTPGSWSPDGDVLAFAENVPGTNWDIFLLSLGGEPQPFLATEFDENQPMFSPDGRWIAFQSNRSGRSEVSVKPYPEGGRIEPISTDGGTSPLWAHSGRELFYRNGEKVMVVSIQTEPTFKAEAPRLLFTYPGGSSSNYLPLSYEHRTGRPAVRIHPGEEADPHQHRPKLV